MAHEQGVKDNQKQIEEAIAKGLPVPKLKSEPDKN